MRRDRYHRSKIDNNQNEIVKALRQIPGISIEVGHSDFLLGYKGVTRWYEVKSPDSISKRTEKPLQSALKPSQIALLADWTGHYKIIWELEQILEELGIK